VGVGRGRRGERREDGGGEDGSPHRFGTPARYERWPKIGAMSRSQ
jgi:hypothetical protein